MSISESLKKKKNLFHIFLLIFSIIATGLIAGIPYGKSIYETQFIDAAIFGYLIIGCILLGATLFQEDIPEKTLNLLCFGGAVLHLVAAILLFVYLNDTYFRSDNRFRELYFSNRDKEYEGRAIGAMIACVLLGIFYLFEFVIDLAKPSLFE